MSAITFVHVQRWLLLYKAMNAGKTVRGHEAQEPSLKPVHVPTHQQSCNFAISPNMSTQYHFNSFLHIHNPIWTHHVRCTCECIKSRLNPLSTRVTASLWRGYWTYTDAHWQSAQKIFSITRAQGYSPLCRRGLVFPGNMWLLAASVPAAANGARCCFCFPHALL